MRKDKILINISNIDDIKKYKKLGISNFLFPLKDFSIGYTSYTFDEIKNIDEKCYVLVNRLLNDEDIDEFLKLTIPKNVKGFIIEDIGLFTELENKGFELINFQNHLNNNYETINYWLKRFDSLVVSTDITLDEIKEILSETTKPLILNTFGYPMIMYSRRTLVSNFYRHLGKEGKRLLKVDESISKAEFILKESEYGTAVFDSKLIDCRKYYSDIDDSKVKYYLVNTEFCDYQTIEDVIEGNEISNATDGFLHKKTVYRVGDLK